MDNIVSLSFIVIVVQCDRGLKQNKKMEQSFFGLHSADYACTRKYSKDIKMVWVNTAYTFWLQTELKTYKITN